MTFVKVSVFVLLAFCVFATNAWIDIGPSTNPVPATAQELALIDALERKLSSYNFLICLS